MTKNFAHRGFSGKYPENTRIAFEAAVRTPGCDGIENDVHLTKDGQLVIIHDETLDRTSTNKKGFIKDMTLSELREAELFYVFKGQYEPQHILTLAEYFDIVKDSDIVTNIELKTGIFEYEGIEEKVLAEIKRYDIMERIIISSFNHFSVLRMKKLCPEIKCGLLTDSWLLNAGKYVKEAGIECYHPILWNNIPEVVEEVHGEGIEINTWTVNEEEDILRMLSLGVDSVIGNFPDRVTALRESSAK